MKEEKKKAALRRDSLWVHKVSNQVLRVEHVSDPYVLCTPLGSDRLVRIYSEQFKYYEPYVLRGGQ